MSRFHGRKVAVFLSAFCVLLSAKLTLAAPLNLKYAKSLTLPAHEKEELIAAPLDSDIFEATRDGLPDLRLLDSQGVEVPFVLRKAISQKDETLREIWTARRSPSARPVENDALEITLELDREEPMPSGVRLVSPLQNFEQHAKVEFSPDGQRWEPLVEDGLIFDYSRYIDVRHDTLRWPMPADARDGDQLSKDAPLRRIRITIDNVTKEQESQLIELTRELRGKDATQEADSKETGAKVTAPNDIERLTVDRRPFRIERIDFFRDRVIPRSTGEQHAEYPLSGMEITSDAEAKRTLITFDSRREPLTSLTVETGASNFSRAAVVEVERSQFPGPAWRSIGSGRLSNIDFRDLDREQLTIPLAETRQPRYRLVIENRDSPPLAIAGLKARGPVYEVVFLAQPNVEYRLAYGGASVKSPDYDTAALTTALAAGYAPLIAKPGQQELLSGMVETSEPIFKRLINDPRFFSVVIVILVIALGVGIYQAGRRVNSHPV